MVMVPQSVARAHVSDRACSPAPSRIRFWSRVRGIEGGTLCGDIILAESLPAGRLALVVCDVLGHGWTQGALAGFLADRVVSMLALGCSPKLALLTADDALRHACGIAVDDAAALVVAW